MTKLFLTISAIILFTVNAKAQLNESYLIDVKGWGRSKTSNSFYENSETNVKEVNTLYKVGVLVGKRIRKDMLVFLNIAFEKNKSTFDYFISKGINANTFINAENFITTILPQVGFRKYFTFRDKKNTGMFFDIKSGWGRQINNNNQRSVHSDTSTRVSLNEDKYNAFAANISFGAYVNITPKWQLIFKIGSIYYTKRWRIESFRSVASPSPIKDIEFEDFGISFSNSDFILSIARAF